MAKKSVRRPRFSAAKASVHDTLETRRWCVEMAIKWPWSPSMPMSSMGGSYPTPGRPVESPDVLVRAKQILEWVSAA
ncbi:hypothetical protein UFOVP1349_23 [uncultured Caudovirales phage]|uniref:Uncharacterized protein n=1 Tax=uncultured Caudovirales phage TaxID=2100421 RepID=A0A6J5SJD6_9CAUD|nr:hypothetical protein UFOVP925_20 [uncultured Caudovirales phage]CAB4184133.1 hypothetical protein UFOVP1097_29 [uncultured Caudovirales phage]CAB4200004.1 hypothetical protein UFOVP1349_23 [uncultured Caudovirales phage]CAB4213911.1 hypothetical protein UFOVP1456_3 [uncultured Caudovirales phage]